MKTGEAPASAEMYSKVVEELRDTAFSAAELALVTGVSERQILRWASGSSRPIGNSRTRLLEIRYVVELLQDVYSPEGAEIWLHSPSRRFDGNAPLEMLRRGEFGGVLEAIQALQDGTT